MPRQRWTEEDVTTYYQQHGMSVPSRLRQPALARHAPYIPPVTLPADLLELPFMEEVRTYATHCGWLTYHTYSSKKSDPGFPDMVLIRGQDVLFVELKTNERTSTPSQEQTTWLYALEYAGQASYLWRPRDWPAVLTRLA